MLAFDLPCESGFFSAGLARKPARMKTTTARMATAAMTGGRGLSAAAGTAWGGGTEESSPASEGRGGLVSVH